MVNVMEREFVVYKTKYSGTKLPKYYIGSTNLDKIKSGYLGSVRSKKYRKIFESELKHNNNLFTIEILSYHDTRIGAMAEELRLQVEYDVVNSNDYFNEAYASKNGYFGRTVTGINHPKYGISNYDIWVKEGGEQYANEMDAKYREAQSKVHGGEGNGMFGRSNEVVAINVKTGDKVRVTKEEYLTDVNLSGHTLDMLTVTDKGTGEKLRINKYDYDRILYLHHNVGFKHTDETRIKLSEVRKHMITAKDWDGNFHRVHKNDVRFTTGEFGNTNSKRWVLTDPDGNTYKTLNINKFLSRLDMRLPNKNRIDEDGLVSNTRKSRKYSSMNGWVLKVLD